MQEVAQHVRRCCLSWCWKRRHEGLHTCGSDKVLDNKGVGFGGHLGVKYLMAERVASLARVLGMRPSTASIMARCSRFSCV